MKTSLSEREIMTLFAFIGNRCLLTFHKIRRDYLIASLPVDKDGGGDISFDKFLTSVRVIALVKNSNWILDYFIIILRAGHLRYTAKGSR